MEWFETLPIFVRALIVILGSFSALGGAFVYWTNSAKATRQEENITEERIRELLKDENELLSHRIDTLTETTKKQAEEITELKKTQAELTKANEMLTKIFQGRDDDALEFREQTRNGIKKNGENIIKIIEHMDKIYSLLEKKL